MNSTPSVFIGLNGPARIGKTHMLKHLTTNYEVSNCNPGEALKTMYALSQSSIALSQYGEEYLSGANYSDLSRALSSDSTFFLLDKYERLKKEAIEQGRGDAFREELIGFAEIHRAFYPEIWVKLAKELFYVEGRVAVGEILNEGEYEILRRHYDYVLPIKLECENPAEGGGDDSRGELRYYSNEYAYDKPTVSYDVAKLIVEDYNEYGCFFPPNTTLPQIEEKPF